MKNSAVLSILCAAVILAGCSASKKDQPKVEVTGDHLRVMVLTREDLGPEYAAFDVDPASGPRTSEQLVEEATNPDDEALDVANYAILLGQEDTYFSKQALAAHTGVISLTDGIVLYADKKGAAGDLVDSLKDQQTGFSGTTKYGSLQAFKTFHPGVGEEAHGAVIRLLSDGKNFGLPTVVTVTITSIQFRRDRMVGAVVVMRFDNKDVTAEITDLARKLDKRMQTVLRGDQPPGSDASTQAQ